ncbi:uncharacterized protein LOC144448578 [Glandiceps talaboti]
MDPDEDKDSNNSIPDAIDAVFHNASQTYEEFLNAFTTLSKEDVVEFQLQNSATVNGSDLFSSLVNGQTSTNSSKENESVHLTDVTKMKQEDSDDLQEEVLEEGTRAPSILMRTTESTGGAVLKVDNFVEDEGSHSESEDSINEDNSDTEVSYQPSCLHIAEPYAETSSEKTESHKQHVSSASTTREALDYDTSKHKESETDDTYLCIQETDTVVRTSTLNEEENKPLDSHFTNIDSSTSDNLDNKIHTSKHLELPLEENDDAEYFDIKPLPGEAEDIPISPKEHEITNKTLLDMSSIIGATPRDEQLVEENQITPQSDSDEVKPFTLDENFDYDNVVLTPKWGKDNHPPGWREGQ